MLGQPLCNVGTVIISYLLYLRLRAVGTVTDNKLSVIYET